MNRRNLQKIEHFVSIDTLDKNYITELIHRALLYKAGSSYHFLEPKFVTTLFLEGSTRARYSFDMAQKKLGIKSLDFDVKSSQIENGETLYDTVLTLSALGVDAVVIRSYEEKYYEELINSQGITCSIINAGDGLGEHPIQTMTDLMTIYESFGTFEGIVIGIVGDMVHSRAAHSNMRALKRLGATLLFYGDATWTVDEFKQYGKYVTFEEVLETADVLMVHRMQTEAYHAGYSETEYFSKFGITKERYEKMKDTSIIMHPGPVKRNVELASELLECERSRITTQIQNGVYMNMAILESVLA